MEKYFPWRKKENKKIRDTLRLRNIGTDSLGNEKIYITNYLLTTNKVLNSQVRRIGELMVVSLTIHKITQFSMVTIDKHLNC